MLSPEPDRFSPQLFPPPAVVRQRIADNLIEAQALRRLLRVSEDVAEHRAKRSGRPRVETSSQ
jgi:hypothetical protein